MIMICQIEIWTTSKYLHIEMKPLCFLGFRSKPLSASQEFEHLTTFQLFRYAFALLLKLVYQFVYCWFTKSFFGLDQSSQIKEVNWALETHFVQLQCTKKIAVMPTVAMLAIINLTKIGIHISHAVCRPRILNLKLKY